MPSFPQRRSSPRSADSSVRGCRMGTPPESALTLDLGADRNTLTRRSPALNDSTECWRAIPGYEGSYEVSTFGRVRSLDRVDHRGYRRTGRPIFPSCSRGYFRLGLSDAKGKRKSYGVHVLVLLAFVGPRPNGYEGCHFDGDPSNNRLSNLRWDSRSENQKDRARHGTDPQLRRTECPRGHALVGTNLSPRHARIGKRACRACDRERSEAKQQNRPFSKANADLLHARLCDGWVPTPMAERDSCLRGHRLSGANLRRAALEKRGQRACRACANELSASRRQGRPFDSDRADALARAHLET